jgi:hypothetical protein
VSQLGEIAVAVVGRLAGLQAGGADVFATVALQQVAERKACVAALGRQRKPAACVTYDGRAARTAKDVVPGPATLCVLLAVENLRGNPHALTGADAATGVFACLEQVTAALDGAVLAADWRLALIDERQTAADERSVCFEQRYRAERLADLAAPTFDGSAIAGSASLVTVEVESVRTESVEFGFPGIDGVYRHQSGTRGRTIRWAGQLIAADDAALDGLEADIERRVVAPVPSTVVDAGGRTYAECVPETFVRDGPRRRHPVTGAAVQAFELTFTQLRV